MSDFRIGTALGRLADAMEEIAKQFERMNDLKEREIKEKSQKEFKQRNG